MTATEELCNKAAAYFHEGYNCTQAVLMALCEQMCGGNEFVPKIATGFGGGIGRCGSVCGALIGSVMAVGIKFGVNELNPEKKVEVSKLSAKLYRQFEKQHGTVLCRELLHCDLSNPEDSARASREKLFEKECPRFVRTAIQDFLQLEEL